MPIHLIFGVDFNVNATDQGKQSSCVICYNNKIARADEGAEHTIALQQGVRFKELSVFSLTKSSRFVPWSFRKPSMIRKYHIVL